MTPPPPGPAIRGEPTESIDGNYHRNKTIILWSNGIESLHRKYTQVYGVPTERSFYHRKWDFTLQNEANGQKIMEIHRK